jgi:hypothetical protein
MRLMDDVPRNTQHLATLARGIKDAIARQNRSRQDWVEATIDLSMRLYEARRQFDAHQDFGCWLDAEHIKIEKNDRAAAIAMAENPKRLREVLETTQRYSLRLIHEHEFRFPTDGKTAEQKKRRHKLAGVEEKQVADAVLDRGKTLEDAAVEFGLDSVQPVKIAVAKEEGRREAANDPVVNPDSLPKTAKAKLEAAIRQHKAKLDREFDVRMREEARRFVDKYILPNYAERLKKADTIIDSSGFMNRWPFSSSQYKQILGALHPDANLSPEKKSDLFQLFKSKEARLKSPVDEDERLTKGGLPRTVEELMERARKKKEEDAAKRAAKKGGS